jgi:predicted DsbA family dithiol-disulfide isomerase
MPTPLHIEFVSDVACPWCAIGVFSLERALQDLQGEVDVDLHFEPFELSPDMGPEGEDVSEHLTKKYGSTAEDQARIRERIAARGAEVGFTFRKEGRGRVWNTFDVHRLLHWAGEQGSAQQRRLKKALLQAYHGEGRSMADHQVLADVAASVDLDRAEAVQVLQSDRYADLVRARERYFQMRGVQAVPSLIVNQRHLIQGGHPPEAFAQALRKIAAEQPAG